MVLPDIQHIAELVVLPKDCIDLSDSLFQWTTDPKERYPPFRKITDNLILEPFPLLVPAAIPGLRVRNVRIAEEE